MKVGLVREQTGWMLDLLGDPAVTGAVIVASPEEMPVNETLELPARIATETNVDLAAVVVNRVLPELFGRGEEEVFDRLREPDGVAALEPGGRRAGRDGPRRGRAGGHAAAHPGRAPHPAARGPRPATSSCSTCPSCSPSHHGVRATRQVAEALGAELGY